MINKFCICFVLFTVFNAIMNYDYYEDHDYESERYSSSPRRERFNEFRRSESSGIVPYASLPVRPKFNLQPIKGAIKGLLSGGKCFIQCIIKWRDTCANIIKCPWNCFFPDKPFPELPAQDDTDIKLPTEPIKGGRPDMDRDEQPPPEPGTLSAKDIINIAKCHIQCILRYTPRSLTTLSQYLGCVVSRCLCG